MVIQNIISNSKDNYQLIGPWPKLPIVFIEFIPLNFPVALSVQPSIAWQFAYFIFGDDYRQCWQCMPIATDWSEFGKSEDTLYVHNFTFTHWFNHLSSSISLTWKWSTQEKFQYYNLNFLLLIAAGVMQIALMTTAPEFRFLAVKFFRPDSFLVSAVSLSLASFESVVLLVELGK